MRVLFAPYVLLLAQAVGARQLDVRCQRKVAADTAAVLGAIRSSCKGDVIKFHGTCVVNETVPLLEGRGYIGESKGTSRIVQADGANLLALGASEAWLKGTKSPGSATRVAHLTLDGNSQANSNTHTLVLRAWLLNVYDVDILNSAEDGVRLTASSANERSANLLTQSQVSKATGRSHTPRLPCSPASLQVDHYFSHLHIVATLASPRTPYMLARPFLHRSTTIFRTCTSKTPATSASTWWTRWPTSASPTATCSTRAS
jgi:hypothetical protein